MAPCFPQGAHQTLCLVFLLFLTYLSMDFSVSPATSIWIFPSFLILPLFTGAIAFFLEVNCPFSLFFLIFKVFEGPVHDGTMQVSSGASPFPFTEIPYPFITDGSALNVPLVITLLSVWDYYSVFSKGTALNLQIFLVFLWDCGSWLPQPHFLFSSFMARLKPTKSEKKSKSFFPPLSTICSFKHKWEILLEIADLVVNPQKIMIFLMFETFKQHLKSKLLQFTTLVFKGRTLPLPCASLNGKNKSLNPQILSKQKCVGSKAVFGSSDSHI